MKSSMSKLEYQKAIADEVREWEEQNGLVSEDQINNDGLVKDEHNNDNDETIDNKESVNKIV